LRDIFVKWLKKIGIDKGEETKEEESREIEREISKIISSLPAIPELMRKQALRKIHRPSLQGETPISGVAGGPTFPNGGGEKGGKKGIPGPYQEGNGEAYKPDKDGKKRGTKISRKSKGGIKIAFRNVPEKEEMGWVDSDLVCINSGHPGYKKTSSNKRSRLLFNLISVAIALQRYLEFDDKGIDLSFVDKFMYAWGK
jgi:hypothetical protein